MSVGGAEHDVTPRTPGGGRVKVPRHAAGWFRGRRDATRTGFGPAPAFHEETKESEDGARVPVAAVRPSAVLRSDRREGTSQGRMSDPRVVVHELD
jgi:hypothetical protein